MIFVATLIWGTAFAAQRTGMEHVGPFTFISVRFFIGGCVTMAAAPLFARLNKNVKRENATLSSLFNKKTIISGLLCGSALFIASTLQQTGIQTTTAGKAGFLTSLYVIVVPVAGLFLRRIPRFWVWPGVILAVAGTYLLCMESGLTINTGDTLILLCAVFFAAHILLIDRFAGDCDGIAISSVQFFVVSAAAIVPMFIFETPEISGILAAAPAILYTGVLSCGVAYTLQIKAQQITSPAVASILFSMESVFAALAGYLFISEHLSARELRGCALVLAAIIVAQIPAKAPFLRAKKS